MLDINLFRTGRAGKKDNGGDPDLVCESQRRRFSSVEIVDEVIDLDDLWRRRQFDLEKIRKELNATSRNTGKLKMVMRQVEHELNKNAELQKDIEEKLCEIQAAAIELDDSKQDGAHEDRIKLSARLNELKKSSAEYCSMMVIPFYS